MNGRLDRKTVHDLLTPLNAVIGFSGIVLAKAEGKLDAKQIANLQRVHDAAKTLLGMIRALGEPKPDVPVEPAPVIELPTKTDREVTVVLEVVAADDENRRLTANGFLTVDGRVIYQMTDFSLE